MEICLMHDLITSRAASNDINKIIKLYLLTPFVEIESRNF